MRTVRPLLVVIVVAGFCSCNGPCFGNEPSDSLRVLIDEHAELISTVAHPTGTFVRFGCNRVETADERITLYYTFTWRNLFDDLHATRLAFEFDRQGELASITSVTDTSSVPVFLAATAAMELIKEAIKDEPKVKDNAALRNVIDQADPKAALIAFLRVRQSLSNRDKSPAPSDEELIALIYKYPNASADQKERWVRSLLGMDTRDRVAVCDELRSAMHGRTGGEERTVLRPVTPPEGPSDRELITLIEGAESLNDRERRYWINALPKLSQEDRQKFRKILIDERNALDAIDRKYGKKK